MPETNKGMIMMKYTVMIILLLILTSCGGCDSSTNYSEVCGVCNGHGVILDPATGLNRVCYECGNPCTACGGYGFVGYYKCAYCGGSGRNQSSNINGSNPSFGLGNTKKKISTTATCDECSCSGYMGIKHNSGAYEGNCCNTDQGGHRCGHSPRHHGLKQY